MTKVCLARTEIAALAFSGAVVYYTCEALSDYFVFREGVNLQVARFFFLFLFPLLAIVPLSF